MKDIPQPIIFTTLKFSKVFKYILIFFMLSLVVTAFAFFQYGEKQAGYHLANIKIKETILINENIALKDDITFYEKENQVKEATFKELKTQAYTQQVALNNHKEELSFFRKVASPNHAKTNIELSRFELFKTNQAKKIRFQLILTQMIDRKKPISGTISFQIHGINHKRNKRSLATKDVLMSGENEIAFSMRYFVREENIFHLPSNFIAKSISVSISTKGRDAVVINKHFDWTIKK